MMLQSQDAVFGFVFVAELELHILGPDWEDGPANDRGIQPEMSSLWPFNAVLAFDELVFFVAPGVACKTLVASRTVSSRISRLAVFEIQLFFLVCLAIVVELHREPVLAILRCERQRRSIAG